MDIESMAGKIQKLLAKAERAGTEEEAATFFAKAQELMAKHAISEAMLDAADPKRANTPTTRKIVLGRQGAGIKARRGLLNTLANINHCKMWMSGDRATLTVAGFNVDVEHVFQMFTSIDLQMASALRSAQREPGGSSSATWKTNFMYGYSGRIGARLREAQRAAQQEAEASVAGVSVVFVGRAQAVERHMNEVTGGRLRKGPPAKHQSHSGAWASGAAAANRANLGGTSIGGNRGQLGR